VFLHDDVSLHRSLCLGLRLSSLLLRSGGSADVICAG
jgi:hypothetical protein